jgi:ATP-dependent Clp protease ATP-binding subunit ClpX
MLRLMNSSKEVEECDDSVLVDETNSEANKNEEGSQEVVKAQHIKNYLDTKVIGQEVAKIQISVLLSMHMNWFKQKSKMHRSPNALVVGPTGVGKTHTLRIASEYLKIPFVAVDTTAIVRAGIVGLGVEEILADLVREAKRILKSQDPDGFALEDFEDEPAMELARRGIIFLDEFDKVNADSENSNIKDSNMSIQRRLLKLTDGATLKVGERGISDEFSSMDTSGILFVAGGAFVGVEHNKIRTKRSAEMQRDLAKKPNVVISEDIVNYGFMPELVARFPILIEYELLCQEDLLLILDNQSISPIQVWKEHFKLLGKELIFTKDAKEFAATKALRLKMGARGLQQVMFPALSRMAFAIESSSEDSYEINSKKLEQAWMKM